MPSAARILSAAPVLVSCAVTNPPGYDSLARSPAFSVQAAPGVMYGIAPHQWKVDDGRELWVDVDRAQVSSGMGIYQSDIAFSIGWQGGEGLRCETEPAGPGVPESRFGCWSLDGESTRFWMAPDEGCRARNAAALSTLTSPRCWTGVLDTPEQRYTLRFGTLEATTSPVGRVSWTGPSGETALAANIIVDSRVRIYTEAEGAQTDALVLQTMALHWWWHASAPD